MYRQSGLWIDNAKTHLFFYSEKEIKVKTIYSEIEDFHMKGGSGSSTPYAPQDVVSGKKLMERKKTKNPNQQKTVPTE